MANVKETNPPSAVMSSPVEVRVKATPVVSLVAGATTREPPSCRTTESSPLRVADNLKVETGVPGSVSVMSVGPGPTVVVVVTVVVTPVVYVM